MDSDVHPVWRQWGTELRRLRELAGVSQTDLGRSALASKATISAWERGTRVPKRESSERLDTALSTGGVLTRLWHDVASQRGVPDWWRSALALERQSREIWEYEPSIVPGLLQTADYARFIIQSGRPRATKAEVEEAVAQRVERLPALQDSATLIRFVVGEAPLVRGVGSEQTMIEQLEHIEQVAQAPAIRFMVLPEDSRPPGAHLPFRVNSLDDTQSVAHVEHALGGVTRDDPESVSDLVTLFGDLAGESLSSRASLDWIGKEKAKWNGERAAIAEPPAATASKSPSRR